MRGNFIDFPLELQRQLHMPNLCISLILSTMILRVLNQQATTPMPRRGIGNCALPSAADLGRPDMLSKDGLVAGGFFHRTDAGAYRPFVRIIDFNYVCQSSGTVRGTVSSVSVVVRFVECSGSVEFCAGEENGNTLLEQFQFDCLAEATDPVSGDSKMNVFTFNPNTTAPTITGLIRTIASRVEADLTTPLAEQCGECADGTSAVGIPATADTHCARMFICN